MIAVDPQHPHRSVLGERGRDVVRMCDARIHPVHEIVLLERRKVRVALPRIEMRVDRHDLAVPEQLAVIGLDDMPLASYFDPPLTTMRQDMQAIGQTAARLLIASMAQPRATPQTLYLPATLVPRRSTIT